MSKKIHLPPPAMHAPAPEANVLDSWAVYQRNLVETLQRSPGLSQAVMTMIAASEQYCRRERIRPDELVVTDPATNGDGLFHMQFAKQR